VAERPIEKYQLDILVARIGAEEDEKIRARAEKEAEKRRTRARRGLR
jgi:hypothetical protein